MKPWKSLVYTTLATAILPSSASNATPIASRDPRTLAEIRQASPSCSDGETIKNLWLVEQLNVTYTSDERVKPGNASFTLTNTLAHTTERIGCSLRANYICELHGTPGDASLYIWLQINLDVARFTLNQSVPCGTGPSKYGILSLLPRDGVTVSEWRCC
jgi:hypothetical protein